MNMLHKKIILIGLLCLFIDGVHAMWRYGRRPHHGGHHHHGRRFFRQAWRGKWQRRHACGQHKHRRHGGKRYAFIQLWVDKTIAELKAQNKPVTKEAIKKKLLENPEFNKAWDALIAQLCGRRGFYRRHFWMGHVARQKMAERVPPKKPAVPEAKAEEKVGRHGGYHRGLGRHAYPGHRRRMHHPR